MERFNEIPNSNLVILGNGTKYQELKECSSHIENNNLNVFDRLPKTQYDQLLNVCDVGLIFLDERFTIPNYPSRLTSYLELGKPVIVSTDKNTDIGSEVVKKECGLWNISTDIDGFIENAKQLVLDKNLRENMSVKAREFFEEEFRIEDNVEKMLFEIKKGR